MRINNRFTQTILAITVASLFGCGGDDTVVQKGNKFAVAFKASTTGETEYLIDLNDLKTGNIDAVDTGIEQAGWNYYYNVDNTIFVSGYTDFNTTAYEKKDGVLTKKASFAFEKGRVPETFGNIDNKILLASDAPRSFDHATRTLHIVDEDSGKVTKKLQYRINDVNTGTAGAGSVAYPLALEVRGDKMFVPFQNMRDDASYTLTVSDKAQVAVYDYPFVTDANGIMQPTKIIEDNRTSVVGTNGSSTGLIETASGDLYSYSNGTLSAGISPASTKPSGILRIKAGTTEFDENYFFDINSATNGGSIFWFDYIGGEKAIARIQINEDECTADAQADTTGKTSCLWSATTGKYNNQKLVIVDLAAKTITDIDGIPLHSKRYTSPINVIDGKVYVNVKRQNDVSLYEVDIATARATKGATVSGKTVKGIFPLN